jgi:isoquinoline 1-oxidoreductase beta subunit
LFGEITFKDGAVQQNNFDTYRVTRINEAPKTLNVYFIKSKSAPGGLGEPATAVVQPAIANAIFAATGKRVRTLPFTPGNIGAA